MNAPTHVKGFENVERLRLMLPFLFHPNLSRKAMAKLNPKLSAPEQHGTCLIVVAYEDTACRAGAMLACNHLVQEFWKDIEFKFSWWRFDYLRDSELSSAAVRAAAKADLVILSAYSKGPFHSVVPQWTEQWVQRRASNEGALLGLFWTQEGQKDLASPKQIYLKDVARRTGMEFLSQVPRQLPSMDSQGAVLGRMQHDHLFTDEYLFRRSPGPEGGINE
jgi:hypothetical protein